MGAFFGYWSDFDHAIVPMLLTNRVPVPRLYDDIWRYYPGVGDVSHTSRRAGHGIPSPYSLKVTNEIAQPAANVFFKSNIDRGILQSPWRKWSR